LDRLCGFADPPGGRDFDGLAFWNQRFLMPPHGEHRMTSIQPIANRLADSGLDLPALVERTGLELRVVEAIAAGRYTPSPDQRRRIASALGVTPEEIAWGHTTSVESLYGHGPQFGRSP
jgi:lambda repressor-like predicted transcriptional regulator